MPSRNSINKPKDTMNQAHRRASVARKRASRARRGEFAPPRSAAASQSGEPKSTALALYSGAQPSGVLTTQTLSKKRLQKIERNKKYVAARNNKLLIDAQAKSEETMEVDEEPNAVQQKLIKINSVKEALWSVVEDGSTAQLIVDAQGEGTTLGGPTF